MKTKTEEAGRAAAGARGGGGERARPRCPAPRPRLRQSGRRRPRAPAGRGREGRERHPVYRAGPAPPAPAPAPGNGLPGEGRLVRTHPRRGTPALRGRRPAPAACRPRLLRVTPVTTLLRTSPPAFSSGASADPSRGRRLPATALPGDRGCGP